MIFIFRTLDGKSYKAYVKEKEEAKQIYEQAVSQGFGAAHVAAKWVELHSSGFYYLVPYDRHFHTNEGVC